MFEKNMQLDWLLDFYGEVLPERTREMMKQYYEDDLSLAEIAENAGITRQGVRASVKHGEEELLRLEGCLGMAKRHRELASLCESLAASLASLGSSSDPAVVAAVSEMLATVERMSARL